MFDAIIPMGVGEGDEVTWVSATVFEEKARALAALPKGAEVYVEGRLIRGQAWQVMPLGQIGRRKPKVQSRDEYERPRDEQGAVPFDEELRF